MVIEKGNETTQQPVPKSAFDYFGEMLVAVKDHMASIFLQPDHPWKELRVVEMIDVGILFQCNPISLQRAEYAPVQSLSSL